MPPRARVGEAFRQRAALSSGPGPLDGESVDNAERLRRPPLWLAPLARLAALVAAALVLKIAGTDDQTVDGLVRLLPLVL